MIQTKNPDNLDIAILNILRCEPPSNAFNFFEYGGLPRSVLKLLQEKADLETLISERSGRQLSFDSLSDDGTSHKLIYEQRDGISSIFVNTHNDISKESDAKFFARTEIKGTDGNKYHVNLLALEVYRKNGNPIWELGFYVTDNEILYGEEIMLELPREYKRLNFLGKLNRFILSMQKLQYDTSLKGITNNNFQYLKEITQEKSIKKITEEKFEEIRAKRVRYLTGTLGKRIVFKFEDRMGYKQGYRIYRVELVNSYLDPSKKDSYYIEIIADTEGRSVQPNEKFIEMGPYSHKEALAHFFRIVDHYLLHLHINAGIDDTKFKISHDSGHIDFRFATVVKNKSQVPITIVSKETPYGLDGRILPSAQLHHYIELYSPSSSLRLDEGVHFKNGLHPRKFMGKLINAVSEIDYTDNSTFIQQAISQGVPLINQ